MFNKEITALLSLPQKSNGESVNYGLLIKRYFVILSDFVGFFWLVLKLYIRKSETIT